MAKITVKTDLQAPAEKVWFYFTTPEHITQWNFAISEWQCPKAENDLRVGGKFNYRMEAKDGSQGFDFAGTYTEVTPLAGFTYKLDDERKVEVILEVNNGMTTLTEVFDAEDENSAEMQKQGWQSILDNFKKYTEEHE